MPASPDGEAGTGRLSSGGPAGTPGPRVQVMPGLGEISRICVSEERVHPRTNACCPVSSQLGAGHEPTGRLSGCGHPRPSSATLPGHICGKAVRGALAVIHLTNQRSSRMSPSEVHAPAAPGATPPQGMPAAGGKEPCRHRRTSQAQIMLARAYGRR
jgi:hypothetical protein